MYKRQTPYLVLEHLKGEGLHRRLLRGSLSLNETFDIVRQVGSALHAAHKAGVVHRDLKPENIFLVPIEAGGVVGQRVKLLDFGISKFKDSDSSLETQDSVLIGTPRYMAPEQAMGHNRAVDARTDVFALGSITYEMLSGAGPFGEGAVAEVVYRVVHTEPASLQWRVPTLPTHVVQAVERAMMKDPTQRFASVIDFVAALTGQPLRTLSSPGFQNTVPEIPSLDRANTVPAPPPEPAARGKSFVKWAAANLRKLRPRQ